MPMLDFPKIETYSRTFCGLIQLINSKTIFKIIIEVFWVPGPSNQVFPILA